VSPREKLARRKGVSTDPRVSVVRCMRCNVRWAPTLVLRRRGYQVPSSWWRCPNLCNGRGTADYDWTSEFTVTETIVTPTVTTGDVLDVDVMPRVKCSGEVLSFSDLESE
jgi:hypothetical protein